MNETGLLIYFGMLTGLALPLALYPLRKTKMIVLLLCPILILALMGAYARWGAWPVWSEHIKTEARQQHVQAVLKTIKSPTELIDKLKARLAENPKSAKGWYLLGRLYASQNAWPKARDAFFEAYQLTPEDEVITVNYAQSLWQLNQQQFNEQIRGLFKKLLEKNSKQPDALAMLAMDAFTSQDYQLAINYWQQLLKLAHPQSEEAQMIRKAIAKAQKKLE